MLRNTLGNAHNEGDLGSDGLLNTSGGYRRSVFFRLAIHGKGRSSSLLADLRYEDGSGSSASLLNGLGDISEDREAEMLLARLLGVCASNDLGTCRKRMSDPSSM